MSNKKKLKAKKAKTQMKVTWCDGSVSTQVGPSVGSKEANEALKYLNKMWKVVELMGPPTVEDLDDEDFSEVPAGVHMVGLEVQSKAPDSDWESVWSRTATCEHAAA